MSTKQSLIIALMLVFMAAMLVSLGIWFHTSIELETKEKGLAALNERVAQLGYLVNGSKNVMGLKEQIENPQTGLMVQASAAAGKAMTAIGNAQAPNTRESTRLDYEAKAGEVEKKWQGDAEPHWKNTFEDWKKLNADIAAAADRARKQVVENEERLRSAQADLDQQLNDEKTEQAKIVVERKKMQDEIGQIRAGQEEVLDKINDVTRSVRKEHEIVAQGKVIQSSPELKTVTINIGSAQGVRKGLQFDVYSAAHATPVRKGVIEVTSVDGASAMCVVLPPKLQARVDPITGWSSTDPAMKYSVYAAGGPEETDAQELQTPKSRADRVEALRLQKIEREQGQEAAEKARAEKETPSTPPSELGTGFVPIYPGDWISSSEFTPIVSASEFAKQTTSEILAMKDINIGSLTFYFTDAVRQYRKDFLKRLCERNNCKTAEMMGSNVSYVVTIAGQTRIDLLEEQLAASKDKDDASVTAEVRAQRKTLAALQEAKKIGAGVLADDEVEAFFERRQRKMELLRGKTIQPGQHVFYVTGETRERSTEQVARWITEHGGVIAADLDGKVDYVVVGAKLDQASIDKIKKLGLKILREDELPRFFGVDK